MRSCGSVETLYCVRDSVGEAAAIENCVHTIPRGFGDSCWGGLGVCILQYTRTWRTASGGGSGVSDGGWVLQHFVGV
jgi:hypothetical protein